jgi:hypothetical protein
LIVRSFRNTGVDPWSSGQRKRNDDSADEGTHLRTSIHGRRRGVGDRLTDADSDRAGHVRARHANGGPAGDDRRLQLRHDGTGRSTISFLPEAEKRCERP